MNQVNLFIRTFEENWELKRIETKLYSLMKHFVKLIEGIIPAFLILDCPTMGDQLDHFGISTISFDKLLDFYQKSYEIIVDAADILIALNNILYRNNYEILPGNQEKSFSERRIEINKIKKIQDCLLPDECFSELLEELPRNRIRNSVGHYATEFNGVTQQITFIDEHQGKRREECLPLIQFAVLCINNFHTIFYFSEVVYQLRKWYFILKGDIPFCPKPIKYSQTQKQKKKIGRNDPCPCGSGKKYKKCCLDKEQ